MFYLSGMQEVLKREEWWLARARLSGRSSCAWQECGSSVSEND